MSSLDKDLTTFPNKTEFQPHNPIRWRFNHITPLDGDLTTFPNEMEFQPHYLM